jgi:hypothetical protein
VNYLFQQPEFIGLLVYLVLFAVAILIEVLVIKYFIRYGINYYFKKLNAYEMEFRINDLDLEIKTHNAE